VVRSQLRSINSPRSRATRVRSPLPRSPPKPEPGRGVDPKGLLVRDPLLVSQAKSENSPGSEEMARTMSRNASESSLVNR
jgi:hypothetical protein